MKTIYLLITLTILITACSSEPESPANDKNNIVSNENTSEQDADTTESVPAIDSAWNYYSAYIGIYDEPALLELSFNGEDVNGRYWYAKHGKALKLEGKLNKETQKYEVTETYGGTITGRMTLSLDKDMSLDADWADPKSGKKEHFMGTVLELPTTKKQKPSFTKYTLDHKIEAYDPETEEFGTQETTDNCMVMRVGQTIVFSYGVIGHNYHIGHIDGTIQLDKNNKGTFNGEDDCAIDFELKGNELIIEEVQSCTYYKGHRAYFGGTLVKK